MKNKITIFTLLLLHTIIYSQSVSKPHTFSSGELIKAAEMNTNFNVLFYKVNQLDYSISNITISNFYQVSTNSIWVKYESNAYYTNGNIGIGTTSPGFVNKIGQLEIKSDDCSLILNRQNNKWAMHVDSDYNFSWMNVSGGWPADILMSLRQNGNLGIGVSQPIAKFEITNSSIKTTMRISDTTGSMTFSNGCLGIGVNTPVYSLDVSRAINDATPIAKFNNPQASSSSTAHSIVEITEGIRKLHLIVWPANHGQAIYRNAVGFSTPNASNFIIQNEKVDGNIIFIASGQNERMRITPSGNIGIGTANPDAALVVKPNNDAITTVSDGNKVAEFQNVGNAGNVYINLKSTASDGTYALALNGNAKGGFGYVCNGDYLTIFNGTDPKFNNIAIKGGNLGIGTNTPTHLIHLAGGAYCNGTGDWITGSDISYKKDIKTLTEYGLEEVKHLRPVTYIHKQDSENKKQIGFIAQEVKKVIPEVTDGEDGSMGMAYQRLVPVLVNAIKEQQQIIESQNAKIKLIMERLDKLEKEIK